MKENLLYFPYIDIPDNGWTIKSILYWQNVGIIVPPKYIELPHQYKPFTIDLMQTDLIQPIFPGEYIWGVRKFDESFIKLVDQPNSTSKKGKKILKRKNIREYIFKNLVKN